jgi:hypothetical protein
MASSHLPGMRHEVRDYLLASMSLLAGKKESHGEFMLASQSLQQKEASIRQHEWPCCDGPVMHCG